MAKKRARASSSMPDKGQVRICFERIIPDELDPERSVRRTLRAHMRNSAGYTLNAAEVDNVTRMALINAKKWPAGSSVTCRFLDGSAKMKSKVEQIAHEWEKYASIKFKFISTGTAEIRISFYADAGSWSAVGRDALNRSYFPVHQPTMNYGWLRDGSPKDEYSRVVLHEFGHALGCVHEHQTPVFEREWNHDAVMEYFKGPPNFWTDDEIKSNVLSKYSPKGIRHTRYDPESIMLYSFDARLFSDNLGPTNSNDKLSHLDIELIKQLYPTTA